jgi:hypothetical protein
MKRFILYLFSSIFIVLFYLFFKSFDKISTRVLASRDRIRAVKENLIACKMLLRCKREELKKLWLEGVEQKYTLYLLEEMLGNNGLENSTPNKNLCYFSAIKPETFQLK